MTGFQHLDDFLIKEHGKPQSHEQYTVAGKACHIIGTIAAIHVPQDHMILFSGKNRLMHGNIRRWRNLYLAIAILANSVDIISDQWWLLWWFSASK
ncbi:MAG: hypothetical protein VCE75_12005 [Alphaproteobacteria bacterium]